MKIYKLRDRTTKEIVAVKTRIKLPLSSLSNAKIVFRSFLKDKNKRKEKPDKFHFEDYEVVEYDLVEKESHPL